MTDHITDIEVVTRILYVLARFQYSPQKRDLDQGEITPDNLFMEKVSSLYLVEPVLS